MTTHMVRGVVVLGLLVCATAPEPAPPRFDATWEWPSLCDLWRQRCCWCPDDYGRKAPPPLPCRASCDGPDDYCAKELPAVPCRAPCAGPDDYCLKKCPIWLPRCFEAWYTCVPAKCEPACERRP